MAGQLTQRWTLSVWGGVARILQNPPDLPLVERFQPKLPRGRGPLVRLRVDQLDDLVREYEAGKSATNLAREFGINLQTALDHLHRCGVPIRSPKAIPDDQLPRVRELYQDGLSLAQIGHLYGCSHTAVSSALERCGTPRRPIWAIIPPDRVPELEALRERGWTYKAIGEAYGCSRFTVAKALAGASSKDAS